MVKTEDILRIMEDLKYIVQAGGNPFQSGGGIVAGIGNIYNFLKAIVKIAVYLILMYFAFIIIFKGYPRVVMDIGTLSLFKKQQLDKLLTEHEFLLKHYKYLLRPTTDISGMNPYSFVNTMYVNLATDANDKAAIIDFENGMIELDKAISRVYGGYKNDDKYMYAFRDYYLFFFKMKSNIPIIWKKLYIFPQQLTEDNPELPQCPAPPVDSQLLRPGATITCQPPEFWVKDWEYYELLTEKLTKDGLLKNQIQDKPQNISNDLKVARVYYNDNEYYYTNNNVKMYHQDPSKRTYYRENDNLTSRLMSNVGRSLAALVKVIENSPFMFYVTFPTNDVTSSNFVNDFIKHAQDYAMTPVGSINEFSHFVFEALAKNTYDILLQRFKVASNNNTSTLLPIFMTAYMGLTSIKREAFKKNAVRNFPELKTVNLAAVTEFMTRYPIFTHIYLNAILTESPNMSKNALYAQVLQAYQILLYTNADGTIMTVNDPKLMLSNLVNNTTEVKQFVNSVLILDMYINEYQPQMSKLYEQHNVSNQMFFKALWKPYYEELWNRRIMPYYQRVFDSKNMGKTYQRFTVPWAKLGYLIKEGKKSVVSTFKKGVDMPVQEPAYTDPTPDPTPKDQNSAKE